MTATAAGSGAAEFVERFADAWSEQDPEAFTSLFHPEVHLIHPMERDTHGIPEAQQFMRRMFDLVPDLRYGVEGWAEGSGQVLIWGRLYGTLAGGGPIEWPLVDRITLEGGLVRKRYAYFDPMVVAGQLARRPRAWLPYLRAQLGRLRGG